MLPMRGTSTNHSVYFYGETRSLSVYICMRVTSDLMSTFGPEPLLNSDSDPAVKSLPSHEDKHLCALEMFQHSSMSSLCDQTCLAVTQDHLDVAAVPHTHRHGNVSAFLSSSVVQFAWSEADAEWKSESEWDHGSLWALLIPAWPPTSVTDFSSTHWQTYSTLVKHSLRHSQGETRGHWVTTGTSAAFSLPTFHRGLGKKTSKTLFVNSSVLVLWRT